MEALGGRRTREFFDETTQIEIVDYMIDVKKALEEHKEFESYIK
jgi:hypothetical protein